MPYNIAANQIPIQPVTNFYQGRALRHAEQMRQQQMANEERRLKAMEDQMRRDEEERQRQIKKDQEDRAMVMVLRAESLGYDALVTANREFQGVMSNPLPDEPQEALRARADAAAQASLDRDKGYAVENWGQFMSDEQTEKMGGAFTWDLETAHSVIERMSDAEQRPRQLSMYTPLVHFRDPETFKIVGDAHEGTPEYNQLRAAGMVPGDPPGRPPQERDPYEAAGRQLTPQQIQYQSAIDKLERAQREGVEDPMRVLTPGERMEWERGMTEIRRGRDPFLMDVTLEDDFGFAIRSPQIDSIVSKFTGPGGEETGYQPTSAEQEVLGDHVTELVSKETISPEDGRQMLQELRVSSEFEWFPSEIPSTPEEAASWMISESQKGTSKEDINRQLQEVNVNMNVDQLVRQEARRRMQANSIRQAAALSGGGSPRSRMTIEDYIREIEEEMKRRMSRQELIESGAYDAGYRNPNAAARNPYLR